MLVNKILGKVNSFLFIRSKGKINLFATILINFYSFPVRDALKFPVLIYGRCLIYQLKGSIKFKCPIKKGMVVIGRTDPVRSLDGSTVLNLMGNIEVAGSVELRRGVHLQTNPNATLFLGSNVFVSDNVKIICSNSISILNNSRIGNDCTIMDTDFHYVMNVKTKVVHAASKPVVIGENNWIGGQNVVKKGAITPEGTIVAGPFSMIGKDYTKMIGKYSIIGGSPAKLIAEDFRRIINWDVQQKLHEYFSCNSEPFHFPMDCDVESICQKEFPVK